uniref:CXXC-type zinc finger protein 1 n=1 Tax=Globodera rostochiensis TaxID=31243 RepID=A0A914HZQ2_GLORO
MGSTKKHSKRKGSEKLEEEVEKHCICDSMDYTTLMICCDYCLVWFHVECVKVTETTAKIIKKFACNFCSDKDPKCVTIYKKWAKGVATEQKASKSDKKKGEESAEEKKIKSIEKRKGRDRSTPKQSVKSHIIEKREAAVDDTKTEDESNNKDTKKAKTAQTKVKREQSKTPDSDWTPKDRPFLGTSITAQQKHQLELQETNPNLRCKKCIGCFRENNCGKCFTCVQNGGKCCMDRICVQVEELLKQQVAKMVDEEEGMGSGELGQKKSRKGRKPKNISAKAEEAKTKGVTGKNHRFDEAQRRHTSDESTVNVQLKRAYDNWMRRRNKSNGCSRTAVLQQEDLQCSGLGCTHSARIGSRYCSDSCGVALAKQRLKEILPQRFNVFFETAPNSQTENSEQVQQIQGKVGEINGKLDELEQWKNNVHRFVVALKNNTQPTSPQKKPNADENMLVGCPVCHGEFPMRESCRHIHMCFVRSERQTTYGTDYLIPNNQYNLYCEEYNKIDRTYCKRLRFACSEHYRDEYGLEMCGCPLSWYKKGGSLEFHELFLSLDDFIGDDGFCQEKQKSCRDHKNWVQTAFSLIDNERLNLLNKYEELCEQRRSLQLKLLQRGDILTLLCNSAD